jgi:hypothetical protein
LGWEGRREGKEEGGKEKGGRGRREDVDIPRGEMHASLMIEVADTLAEAIDMVWRSRTIRGTHVDVRYCWEDEVLRDRFPLPSQGIEYGTGDTTLVLSESQITL